MIKCRAVLIIVVMALCHSAKAEQIECDRSAQSHLAQDGQMLQAMVELWWFRKRLPMHQNPDHVSFKRSTKKSYIISYFRQGCSVASLTLPADLLQRFLRKRIGPEV